MVKETLSSKYSKKKMSSVILIICLTFLLASFLVTPKAHAFSLGNVIKDITGIFTSSTPAVTVTSQIALAPNGDINHNGQISAGDTITYSYTIINTTNTSYKFVTLRTNIDTKVLNNISNVQGTVSLDQNNNTITIPNISLDKNQVRKISLDAQINFDDANDHHITTQPVLVDQNGKTVATGTTQSITATKMDTTIFNKFVHITK
jgi:hypothetical protein